MLFKNIYEKRYCEYFIIIIFIGPEHNYEYTIQVNEKR